MVDGALSCRWEENDSPSNSILQRALLNYINTYVDVLRQLPDGDLQLKKRARPEAADTEGGGKASKSAAGGDEAGASEEEERKDKEHDFDVSNIINVLQ